MTNHVSSALQMKIFFGRMKHIYIKLKFILDVVSRNYIMIEYISTDDQIAVLITKALSKKTIHELLQF